MKKLPRTIPLDEERWLEPLRPGEEGELFALVQRNRPHLRRFFSWPKDNETVEMYRSAISGAVGDWADETSESYPYAIRQENVGILGHIALMKSDEGLPEMGYWIGKEYTKRGIAKTALRQLTSLAHEKLEIPTIALEIREDNIGSQRVAIGAGYELVREGVAKEGHAIPYNIWHSNCESRLF